MQCRDEKHIILVLEFIIQLTLQAKNKNEKWFKCHFQTLAAKRKQLIKRRCMLGRAEGDRLMFSS